MLPRKPPHKQLENVPGKYASPDDPGMPPWSPKPNSPCIIPLPRLRLAAILAAILPAIILAVPGAQEPLAAQTRRSAADQRAAR